MAQNNALLAAAKKQAEKKKQKAETAQPKLEPNQNHLARQRVLEAAEAGYELVEATGVDAALAGLEVAKAETVSYKQFEARELPGIKEDNPGLKHNQLKELAWKKWKKSPENPENQK